MPLKNEMKSPENFSNALGVLNVGSAMIVVLMTSLGSVGYLKFGEAVQGSLTLNLAQASM